VGHKHKWGSMARMEDTDEPESIPSEKPSPAEKQGPSENPKPSERQGLSPARGPININPSWRCVQGGEAECRQSLDFAQILGDASGVNGAQAADEGKEGAGAKGGNGDSLWFPQLRKEGRLMAQRMRNFMRPEGVHLHNQGVQAGESFVPQEKQQLGGGGNRLEPEGLESVIDAAHDQPEGYSRYRDGLGGPGVKSLESARAQEAALTGQTLPKRGPPELGEDSGVKPSHGPDEIGGSELPSETGTSSNRPGISAPGGQNEGRLEAPEASTSSTGSGRGSVRHLEIKIQENGDVKAEEVWREAMQAQAIGGGEMGRSPSEYRKLLSKLPSEILPKGEGKACVLAIGES
jgi:hypothetical protein